MRTLEPAALQALPPVCVCVWGGGGGGGGVVGRTALFISTAEFEGATASELKERQKINRPDLFT